jgi:N-acetylglucosaminyldiphosphoundecaprenol N-acetyl-beta-D-mannosaminyltransferase
MTTINNASLGHHNRRQPLFGLDLDPLRMDEVVARAGVAVAEHMRLLIGVVNAAKIVNMRKDPLLRESLLAADVLLADGQSVVWASRLLGHPVPERVAGIDLFEHLLAYASKHGQSVYFLGARPEVLASMLDRVDERFPGLRIAGSRDGYFTNDDSPNLAAEIAASHADMLFLGITSPKKEIFLSQYGDSLDVPVMHGVGGSFDILAGITRRAPVGWQRVGFEWAYRLLQEPRRMAGRYLPTNTIFLALTVREKLRPAAHYCRELRSRATSPMPTRGNDSRG